ncbi:MAG: hypothetical protein GY737_32260 [Desulfobacteraceae bacterium]|nr:hypothetical protein [Desulfobacteraceae bacterium]
MKNNTSIMERPILIVDDEREILAAVERILRTAGMTHTITINDARDVIRQIERRITGLSFWISICPISTACRY